MKYIDFHRFDVLPVATQNTVKFTGKKTRSLNDVTLTFLVEVAAYEDLVLFVEEEVGAARLANACVDVFVGH